jgi:hypothetical protein
MRPPSGLAFDKGAIVFGAFGPDARGVYEIYAANTTGWEPLAHDSTSVSSSLRPSCVLSVLLRSNGRERDGAKIYLGQPMVSLLISSHCAIALSSYSAISLAMLCAGLPGSRGILGVPMVSSSHACADMAHVFFGAAWYRIDGVLWPKCL